MNRRQFLALTGLAAPASALAAPSRSPSPKKGLGIVARDDQQWRKPLQQVASRWFYSWGAGKPKDVPAGIDFVPMIWGYWGNDASIAKAGADAKAAGLKELLGFNEPDQKQQSNLSVEKVLAVWPQLMKTGLRLGSPGCVHPDREWMKEFMKGVKERDLKVDFVCVHSYGGTDADAFIRRLEAVHAMYDKPPWTTEFAGGDWLPKTVAENRHKPAQVADFMRKVLPKLDALGFVERYAWFPAGENSAALGTSALFKKDGTLTPLGEIYRSH